MTLKWSLCDVLAACLVVAGCAGEDAAARVDPGARVLAAGETCESLRGELNRLDARGVPALFERSKVSTTQKADIDRYNHLLNQYLGARCHV